MFNLKIKKTTFLVVMIGLLFLQNQTVFAQKIINLWPEGKMPNSKGMNLEHKEARERITQVKTPQLRAYFTSKDENTGAAVIICPPGGYQKLTYQIAGDQFAKWLNSKGINAFVLLYRLPNSPDLITRQLGPIQDSQRAIKYVRANADAWGIDTTKIGIMGASAGGHLAAHTSAVTEDYSSNGDSLDQFPYQPDFTILISAVNDLGKYAHVGSRNNLLGENATESLIQQFSTANLVTSQTPPAFIVHAVNDNVVPVQNSLLYFQALMDQKINESSLHIFPQGGHSIALNNNPGSTEYWYELCIEWLKEIKMIP